MAAARAPSRRGHQATTIVSLAVLVAVAPGSATAATRSKCLSAKLEAMGTKEAGLLSCLAGVATRGRATNFGKCFERVEDRYARAYDRAGACGDDDRSICDCLTEHCAVEVRAALPDTGPSKCEGKRLRAAGTQAMRKVRCNSEAARTGAPVDPGCLQKAEARYQAAFAKTGNCGGDRSAVDTVVNEQCVIGIGGDASGGATIGDLCTSHACDGAD